MDDIVYRLCDRSFVPLDITFYGRNGQERVDKSVGCSGWSMVGEAEVERTATRILRVSAQGCTCFLVLLLLLFPFFSSNSCRRLLSAVFTPFFAPAVHRADCFSMRLSHVTFFSTCYSCSLKMASCPQYTRVTRLLNLGMDDVNTCPKDV